MRWRGHHHQNYTRLVRHQSPKIKRLSKWWWKEPAILCGAAFCLFEMSGIPKANIGALLNSCSMRANIDWWKPGWRCPEGGDIGYHQSGGGGCCRVNEAPQSPNIIILARGEALRIKMARRMWSYERNHRSIYQRAAWRAAPAYAT